MLPCLSVLRGDCPTPRPNPAWSDFFVLVLRRRKEEERKNLRVDFVMIKELNVAQRLMAEAQFFFFMVWFGRVCFVIRLCSCW